MQLTCTLAIFACLFAADAAACNLSTGTAPFAVAAVPSAEAGDALRAPALEMVSLTRGINGRASCDASGLLTMSVEWPRGTDYKLRELGFEFRVVGGEDRLSIFPKAPVTGRVDGRRSEFVFLDSPRAPDLAAQEAEYRRVLDALGGRPLVVRTLDVGGDKPLPYWPIPAEANPYLGVRGIRLTLQRPQIFETQLRALLRAAAGRALRIMFPMVGQVEEWRRARDLALALREEYDCADLQLGIMVEVPSAALLAPVLAREVDFFSVGTNDLTQYALAIDRGHPTLSAQADGLHPAVLQLIDMTVRAAHAHGKWVGVCGELAADAQALPVLLGLAVDELSVSARSIPLVKQGVRELDLGQARELAGAALGLASAAEVRALVARALGEAR